MTIDVLDKGKVELQEHMGGDAAIVLGARICYQTEPDGADRDRRLIRRLIRSEPKHNTPFEHCVMRFAIKCPLFVARQWMRHRIASYNEKSLRYCEATREFYVPWSVPNTHLEWDYLRYHAFNVYVVDDLTEERIPATPQIVQYVLHAEESFDVYEYLLNSGWKREQARAVLPAAVYTEFIWTVNAWSLLNFISKRTDPGAQWEIQQYAKAVHDLATLVMPITMSEWDARESS